ncbi:hypothetical protein FZEAL_6439 [Fusarium zealandicum]|uniref:Uncharacterized protein n=1 Tax=Fusarium zealandicum TaxID=1053134 RepID=A0A8H4UIK1_9HYPO|nr:hypothetical protein FZEAL_6439 [Fusarium zealandicum]
MTGKPTYKPEEIHAVMEWMVNDHTNDEISSSFDRDFGRPLTDNQIRYLRNKYGKDPDFGNVLVNRPKPIRPKRRRAAASPLPEALPPAKLRRLDGLTGASAPVPSVEIASPATNQRQPPQTQPQRQILIPRTRTALPQTRQPRPSEPSQPYIFSTVKTLDAVAPSTPSRDNTYTPSAGTSQWRYQPRTTFATNFLPINPQLQHSNSTPAQDGSVTERTGSLHVAATAPQQPPYFQPTHNPYYSPRVKHETLPTNQEHTWQAGDEAAFQAGV